MPELELPLPDMLGQFLVLLPVLGVAAGVEAAVCWATVEPLGELAASAVRVATPKPSPESPATVAPTRSIRLTTGFIAVSSMAAYPRRFIGRAGWPLAQ